MKTGKQFRRGATWWLRVWLLTLVCLVGVSQGAKAREMWLHIKEVTGESPSLTPTGNIGTAFGFSWICYCYDGDNACYEYANASGNAKDGSSDNVPKAPNGSYYYVNKGDGISFRIDGEHKFFINELPGMDWVIAHRGSDFKGGQGNDYVEKSFTYGEGYTGKVRFARSVDIGGEFLGVNVIVWLGTYSDGKSHEVAIVGRWQDEGCCNRGPRVLRRTINAPNGVVYPSVMPSNLKRVGNKTALVDLSLQNTTFKCNGQNVSWRYSFDFFNENANLQEGKYAVYGDNAKNGYRQYRNDKASPDGLYSENVNVEGNNCYHSTTTPGTMSAKIYIEVDNYNPQKIYTRIDRWCDSYTVKYSYKRDLTMSNYQAFQKTYAPIVLPGYLRAKNVKVNYNPWNKEVKLEWGGEVADIKNYNAQGKWVIFRQMGDDASTRERLVIKDRTLDVTQSNSVDSYTDASAKQYGKTYKYYIVFQPNEWNVTISSPDDAKDLWASVDQKVEQTSEVFN